MVGAVLGRGISASAAQARLMRTILRGVIVLFLKAARETKPDPALEVLTSELSSFGLLIEVCLPSGSN
jgi:hypothetical protein